MAAYSSFPTILRVNEPHTKKMCTKQRNAGLVEIESISRRQNKCDRKIKISCGKGKKHRGKRRKCWLPAFSPFPTMFSRLLFQGR